MVLIPVAANVHWLVPRSVNPLFVGRKTIIQAIVEAISPDKAGVGDQKRFVLTGMGGQGKSEVCLRVANEVRDRYVSSVTLSILGSNDQPGSGAFFGSI